MSLDLADVKAAHAELDRLSFLLEQAHPWPEVALQAGYAASHLVQLAPRAELPEERRAIVVGLRATAEALAMAAYLP